jgi:hypothetical protein
MTANTCRIMFANTVTMYMPIEQCQTRYRSRISMHNIRHQQTPCTPKFPAHRSSSQLTTLSLSPACHGVPSRGPPTKRTRTRPTRPGPRHRSSRVWRIGHPNSSFSPHYVFARRFHWPVVEAQGSLRLIYDSVGSTHPSWHLLSSWPGRPHPPAPFPLSVLAAIHSRLSRLGKTSFP